MEEPRRVVSELAALGLTLASRGWRPRHAVELSTFRSTALAACMLGTESTTRRELC